MDHNDPQNMHRIEIDVAGYEPTVVLVEVVPLTGTADPRSASSTGSWTLDDLSDDELLYLGRS